MHDVRIETSDESVVDAWAQLIDRWHEAARRERVWMTHTMRVEDGALHVDVRLVAKDTARATASSRYEGQRALYALERRIEAAEERLRDAWCVPAAEPLKDAFRRSRPAAMVVVPVRTAHAAHIRTPEQARAAVTAAVHAHWDYWPEVLASLRELSVERVDERLALASPSGRVVDAAVAYLAAPVGAGVARRSPGQPVWAWASAAIALVTAGLSFLPLTPAALVVLGAVVVAIAAAAVAVAPRWGARRPTTFWGLAPALTLVLFACVYGAVALASDGSVELAGNALRHLRDPLLLSIGLLTTAGMLDVRLAGWVRSIAYLEMLMVAGLAGGAAVVAVRRASQRVAEIAAELRDDRREPEAIG